MSLSPLQGFACVGLNHQTAPMDIREKVSFPDAKMTKAFEDLLGLSGLSEAMILSTCNRSEVYVQLTNESALKQIEMFFSKHHEFEHSIIRSHLYAYKREEALTQLFTVATSLDSQLIGEPQILGQVKTAYHLAKKMGALGPKLEPIFQNAFRVAKKIRTETGLGKNAISLAFAALKLAKKVFSSMDGLNVSLVGAGEMGTLFAKHFHTNGAKLTILNRTRERGLALASRFSADYLPLEKLQENLLQSDLVVFSLESPTPLLCKANLKGLMQKRRYRPLFLIDISLPRVLAPDMPHFEGIYRYDLDDLAQIVRKNMDERKHIAERAKLLIQNEVADLITLEKSKYLSPQIAEVKNQAFSLTNQELQKAFGKLKHLSVKDRETVEDMAHRISKKMLHHQIQELKSRP